jgi:hypothetical protein
MDKTDKNAIALLKKYPNAKFSIGETYDSLNWKDEETNKPTEQEFNTALEDYDSKQYQRNRASQYPSTADQLDMLYHQGIDGWKAEIKKVKDAHPKPEST